MQSDWKCSEMGYESLFGLLPDAVYLLDEDYQIIFANTKAIELLGLTNDAELFANSFEDLLPIDFFQAIKEGLISIVAKNSPPSLIEGTLMRSDSTSAYVEAFVTKIACKEELFLIMFRDITERKKIEEKLRKSYMELEGTLKKLQNTQGQLIHQEKLAGIGQLAAGIAHEINNPLGFLLSNLNTLEKYFSRYKEILLSYQEVRTRHQAKELIELDFSFREIEELENRYNLAFINDDLGEIFVETNEGIDRVGKIVKGLRLFSRVDSLNEYGDYDLNEGINNTLVVTRNELKYYANIELQLNPLPTIQAMGGSINQVLLNLLINAVYAIRAKGLSELGLIKIKTSNEHGFLYCSIEDNGIGIEEKHLRQIFDPFFTTKPPGEGTGLGLSIAYEIITNKHHGELTVESEKGVGTKFTIKIPS